MLKYVFPVLVVWTLVSIILHLCGVGSFAVWPIIAGPLTWSCCCLLMWDFIIAFAALFILLIIKKVCGD